LGFCCCSYLTTSTDNCLKDYLTSMWETGCRASEIRIIEAKHSDGGKIILGKTNSEGKRYNRVLHLTDTALRIVKRLAAEHPKEQWTARPIQAFGHWLRLM
jgi:integrase